MLTKISHAGLPRRFFQNRNSKHRHSHYKKGTLFFKKQWNWDPFHVPRGTRHVLKRTPFYREILVGDDNINGSSGTPGETVRTLNELITQSASNISHKKASTSFRQLSLTGITATNRRQCFRYKQTLSDYAVLTASVPQGTKLGSITFQIIINDAACISNTSCWYCIDDLTFGENRPCKNDSKMQVDLDDFLEWSKTNQLKLNPTKCHAIPICSVRNPPPHLALDIGTKSLSVVSSAKVLGIWLQDHLKWDS